MIDVFLSIQISETKIIVYMLAIFCCKYKKYEYMLNNSIFYWNDYIKILDICNKIEHDIINIFGQNNLKSGVAFPPGVSLNNCVCHDTANVNETRTINYDDVCKIDFGTHINGHIIDCAFTVAFNPEYEPLLVASKEATYSAIKMIRPDVLVYDISKNIKEVIESYEVTIKGKTYDVKANAGDIHHLRPCMVSNSVYM